MSDPRHDLHPQGQQLDDDTGEDADAAAGVTADATGEPAPGSAAEAPADAVGRDAHRSSDTEGPGPDRPEGSGADRFEGETGADMSAAAPGAEVEPTGNPVVDSVLDSMAELDRLPPDEHVAVFEAAHERLRSALSDAGEPPADS